jgi:hypothetical protein
MRKIVSKKQEDKKRKRNQLAVGGVLILIMFMSVLGYSIGKDQNNSNEKVTYNGFNFIKEDNLWILNKDNFKFYFQYNPNEVEKISTTLKLLDKYTDKPLYVYSANSETEAEIYRNLFYYNKIVQRIQNACPEGEKCSSELPIKTCSDNFIIIKESNSSSVKQDNNCVFIEGKSEDLIKIIDSFLFKITGVQ